MFASFELRKALANLMAKHVFTLPFQKAVRVQDDDGVLTALGMGIAQSYAELWLEDQIRDTELERKYPELLGLFYDIRSDVKVAREYAHV